MRRTLALLAAMMALSARGDRVSADGPLKYDLGRKDIWKVGDIATETFFESEDDGFTFTQPGAAAPQKMARSKKTNAVLVRKCLEADLEGGLAKSLVYVKSWSFDNGHGAETSLEGAFVEANGRGKDRTWRMLAAPKKLSDPAKAWLESTFGASKNEAEAARRMWFPKAPVAVGDTWTADLAPYLDEKFKDGPVDREKATSSVRLVSVENDVARIACEAKIPFTGVPGKKGADPMPWKSGGVLELTGEVTVKLAQSLGGGAESVSHLKGLAERDGKEFGVDLGWERRQKTELGGTMPPVPKTEASVAMDGDPK